MCCGPNKNGHLTYYLKFRGYYFIEEEGVHMYPLLSLHQDPWPEKPCSNEDCLLPLKNSHLENI